MVDDLIAKADRVGVHCMKQREAPRCSCRRTANFWVALKVTAACAEATSVLSAGLNRGHVRVCAVRLCLRETWSYKATVRELVRTRPVRCRHRDKGCQIKLAKSRMEPAC